MSRRFDVEALAAIDVHVHLEHRGARVEADAAAAKYFGKQADGDWGALAEYYRSRKMACVVFGVDERLSGRPRVSNEEVLEFAAANADVALPFVSLDPNRGAEAVAEAKRLVARGDVRGLKLHPPLQQFVPSDRVAYPLYEVFAEARLPVVFHTGHSGIGSGMRGGGGVRLKYGDPMPIDDVAVDFPDLPIVMAHPSFPWQDEAISVCLHKPQVRIDLSGWSPKYFSPVLVQYANTLLREKVLFGSDYPLITPDRWLADFAAIGIRDEVRPLILKHNAARLLGLLERAARGRSALRRQEDVAMPAFRADQVGSFLRPQELIAAREAEPRDEARLKSLEDQHVLRVLGRQQELGFEVFTDGELRRRNFMSDFTDAVEGFDLGDAVARAWQAGGAQPKAVSSVAGIVTGKLKQVRRMTGHELPFLKAHSPGAIKLTLPSATQFPAIAWKRGVTDAVYADHSALLWDIVAILKDELGAASAEGASYLQIDAPRYSYFMDPKWREWIRAEMRVEPEALLTESIRADNACLAAARRPGVTLAMHLCRGNNRSHWYAEGGYDAIAEELFGSMDVERFLLEYDDARSGSFEPLRFVPKGKTVVLGLVSSKRPALESADELARRIDEAARYVPLESLALSPQCGFASTMEGNLLSEDEQWAKLRLVAETARRVWG